jgi:hypothetical protein
MHSEDMKSFSGSGREWLEARGYIFLDNYEDQARLVYRIARDGETRRYKI